MEPVLQEEAFTKFVRPPIPRDDVGPIWATNMGSATGSAWVPYWLFHMRVAQMGTIRCMLILHRCSHLFLVGAAEIERRRRECEHRMCEAMLGGSGGIK